MRHAPWPELPEYFLTFCSAIIATAMLKVGLTGGIACGKSYTLKEFQKLGVYGIDLDQVGHLVIEPDRPAYHEVVEAFGREILDSEGLIDRKRLGRIVFSDEEARERLNAIVHPYIFEEEQRRLTALQYPLSNLRPKIVMIDAALMVETGYSKNYDVLIVVYCKLEVQLRRLLYRDMIPEDEALRRINSQMPLLEKVKYGDYVIENSGKLSNTQDQIRHVYAELLALVDEE